MAYDMHLDDRIEEVLITITPDVNGVIDAALREYASKAYTLKSRRSSLYRIRLDDMPGFMSIVQRSMKKGLIREVYIRPQQEVSYGVQDLEEHPDLPGGTAVIVWDDDSTRDEKPGRTHLMGWRVSPPMYTLQELLAQDHQASM